METDTTGQNSHDLRIRCHLRREENHSNEYEQRTEHIHEVWHEIEVIVKDNRLERGLLADKIINLLTDVEDDDNTDDQQQSHEEGRDELLDYICIQFSWSERKIHASKVLWLSCVQSHPSMP